MITVWTIAVVPLVLVVGLRYWLIHHASPRRHTEPFDGEVFSVARAAMCERRTDNPGATVIAVHGFLEDARYFTDHYSAADVQLILLTSCDYHVPFGHPPYPTPSWAKVPSAPQGTITYDAEVLVQALEHLPRTKNIRLHGHSRGGAVILEAAKLRPDLFADVEVLLEAPVLPRGDLYSKISPVLLWLLPFAVLAWRNQPISKYTQGAYGRLDHPRKRHLVEGHPFHPRTVAVMLENIQDLQRWMRDRDHSLYANVRRGVVLVPARDKVLDRVAMLESAKQAAGRLEIVEVDDCSHFVIFDRPDVLPDVR